MLEPLQGSVRRRKREREGEREREREREGEGETERKGEKELGLVSQSLCNATSFLSS